MPLNWRPPLTGNSNVTDTSWPSTLRGSRLLFGLRNASSNSLMRPSASWPIMLRKMAPAPSAAQSRRTWRVLVEGICELLVLRRDVHAGNRPAVQHARQHLGADARQQAVRQDPIDQPAAAVESRAAFRAQAGRLG